MELCAARPWLFRRVVEAMMLWLLKGLWTTVRGSTILRGAPATTWVNPCNHSWLQIRTKLTKKGCKATCSSSLIQVSRPILPRAICTRASWGTTLSILRISTTSITQWSAGPSPPVPLQCPRPKADIFRWTHRFILMRTTSTTTPWTFIIWCKVITWTRCLPTHRCFKGYRLLIISVIT